MSIYEYRCRKCKKQFELRQRMEERGRGVCPACDSSEVENLFSVFGVGVAGSSEKGSGPDGCEPENCRCGKYGGDD